jgi:hypothetical protein
MVGDVVGHERRHAGQLSGSREQLPADAVGVGAAQQRGDVADEQVGEEPAGVPAAVSAVHLRELIGAVPQDVDVVRADPASGDACDARVGRVEVPAPPRLDRSRSDERGSLGEPALPAEAAPHSGRCLNSLRHRDRERQPVDVSLDAAEPEGPDRHLVAEPAGQNQGNQLGSGLFRATAAQPPVHRCPVVLQDQAVLIRPCLVDPRRVP